MVHIRRFEKNQGHGDLNRFFNWFYNNWCLTCRPIKFTRHCGSCEIDALYSIKNQVTRKLVDFLWFETHTRKMLCFIIDLVAKQPVARCCTENVWNQILICYHVGKQLNNINTPPSWNAGATRSNLTKKTFLV